MVNETVMFYLVLLTLLTLLINALLTRHDGKHRR